MIMLVFGILLSLVVNLISSDLDRLFPKLARQMVHYKASTLPTPESKRYREQWLADLDEISGHIQKLLYVIGLFLDLGKIRNLVHAHRRLGTVLTKQSVATQATTASLNVTVIRHDPVAAMADLSWLSPNNADQPRRSFDSRHRAYMQSTFGPPLGPFPIRPETPPSN